MSRNRKNGGAGVRFAPVVKAVLLCLLVGGSGVGYVWQREQIEQLGRDLAVREQQLKTLRRDNERSLATLRELQQVSHLSQQIQRLKLGLVETEPGRIWKLTEPTVEAAEPRFAEGVKPGREQ